MDARRLLLFVFVCLLLIPLACAVDEKLKTTPLGSPLGADAAGDSSAPAVGEQAMQQLQAEVEAVGQELGVDINNIDINQTVVILGENLDSSEKTALAYGRTQTPELFANTIPATQVSFEDVDNSTRLFLIAGRPLKKVTQENSDKSSTAAKTLSVIDTSGRLIMLIGGPSQNRITGEFSDRGLLSENRKEVMNQLVATEGRTSDGTRVIVISDKRGFANIARAAATYSPLAKVAPVEWVPLIASFLGALFTILLSIIKAYVENRILEHGKKGKVVHKKTFKLARLKVREVFAILGAAFVLGAAMSWTYAGPSWKFAWLMVLNTVICVVAGLSHEVIHWLAGRLLKVETEYRFWWSGSIATLVTAFLGNSFGLQGFLVEEVEENVAKWKLGLIKLASPVFSSLVMIIAAAINFFIPHVLFQMTYSIAGIIAMAEILPVKPMDGYDVRKWNIFIWLAAFAFISVSFIIVSFVL
jgi:hypothetical protein